MYVAVGGKRVAVSEENRDGSLSTEVDGDDYLAEDWFDHMEFEKKKNATYNIIMPRQYSVRRK